MDKVITLIRRELWEQRILFLYFPFGIAVFLSVVFAVHVIRAYLFDYPVSLLSGSIALPASESAAQIFREFALEASMDAKVRFWNVSYTLPLLYLVMSYWGSMVYYFLMTLYSQRKDKSILFWNSMPVSDAQTVISKLLAGLLCCHVVYLLSMLFLNILMMGIFCVYAFLLNVDVWSTIVLPANIMMRFIQTSIYLLLSICWCLPVYGWFLLASAWARSAPFAWAMGPILILVVIDQLLFGVPDVVPTSLITFVEHTVPIKDFFMELGNNDERTRYFLNIEMLISVLLAGVFIGTAIKLNRSEDA